MNPFMFDDDEEAVGQGSLPRANLDKYHPASRIYYPIEATVVGIHYPQDKENLSGREIEYDVQPLLPNFGVITNVPVSFGVHGLVDDEVITLTPASQVILQDAQAAQSQGAPTTTDGDRVLVQFINGNFASPIITGILTHRQNGQIDPVIPKYTGKLEVIDAGPTDDTAAPKGYVFGDGTPGSTQADLTPHPGNRFQHKTLNGTHMAVDGLGNVFVNFKPHPDDSKGLTTGNVTKKLVVQNEGKDLLRVEMKAGGQLEVVVGETFAAAIKVAIGDGAKSVAIAEFIQAMYVTAVTGIKAVFEGHVHTCAGPGAPSTPPMFPAPPNPAMFPAWDANVASTKVKIPAN